MLRPDVAAKNSNFLSYANGNIASQKLIDKAVLDDRTVYPDAATMATLYTITARDQRTQRLINRLWTQDQDRQLNGDGGCASGGQGRLRRIGLEGRGPGDGYPRQSGRSSGRSL